VSDLENDIYLGSSHQIVEEDVCSDIKKNCSLYSTSHFVRTTNAMNGHVARMEEMRNE
jgi:hypothetical protein